MRPSPARTMWARERKYESLSRCSRGKVPGPRAMAAEGSRSTSSNYIVRRRLPVIAGVTDQRGPAYAAPQGGGGVRTL
jgi:hypothetical protein